MDELTEVAAFDAWCVLSNPFHHTTDDGISNRRDWEVWQARAKIEAGRELRQGDAGELPPLPDPHQSDAITDLFTAPQMREYAQAAIEAAQNDGYAEGRMAAYAEHHARLADQATSLNRQAAEIDLLQQCCIDKDEEVERLKKDASDDSILLVRNGQIFVEKEALISRLTTEIGEECGLYVYETIAAMTQEVKA